MDRSSLLTACIVLCLTALPAQAQYVPMDFSAQTFTSMNISAGYLLSKSALDSSQRAASPKGAAASTTTQGRSNVPQELAQSFPAAERKKAEQSFSDLLRGFAQIEKHLGLQSGDLAGAMACLVIGSYEGYHDKTVDPNYYQPVIRQLRAAMAQDPRFAKLPHHERRALYERMAVLGMYVTSARLTLTKQPDAAQSQRLRESAAGYLRYLQLDPATLQISANGLALGARQ
jgi:hypothetical protein